MVKIDLTGLSHFLPRDLISDYMTEAISALDKLKRGDCRGSEMTGWLRIPEEHSRDELVRIRQIAARVKKDSAAIVVIGIGGSYIGAKAGLDLIKGVNYNVLPKGTPDIYFAGNNLSGRQLKDVVRLIGDRDFSVIVISKSGTTTEPAVAFRIFRGILEDKYGKTEARHRIYAITDDHSGALRKMAEREGWESFTVPDDIGGRYSLLTPVGLLPLACAGVDPQKVMVGAYSEMQAQLSPGRDSSAVKYAAARELLYKNNYNIEVLSEWEAESVSLGEWWKQLFGESEGKEQQGIFPAVISCSGDLHSLGQFVQEGRRNIFETFLLFEPHGNQGFRVPAMGDDADGIEYLSGSTLIEINETAARATRLAHIKGGVPCISLRSPAISDEGFGSLCYFFMLSCALSCVMRGLNAFDQPGVEEYKRNMFALLGKPGYKALADNLLKNGN